jgi:hypothetical protein
MKGDATTSRGKTGNTTTRWRIERQRRINGGGSLVVAVAAAATPTKVQPWWPVATKTSTATAMAGAQTTINN